MDNKEIKIRKDLNEIVSTIRFAPIKSKYGVRHVPTVTFFNGKTMEFADPDNYYNLLQSYVDCGEKDFIQSRELIEDISANDVDNVDARTYIAVKYELKDGTTFYLFPKDKFVASKIIDNYYTAYKAQKKVAPKQN